MEDLKGHCTLGVYMWIISIRVIFWNGSYQNYYVYEILLRMVHSCMILVLNWGEKDQLLVSTVVVLDRNICWRFHRTVN